MTVNERRAELVRIMEARRISTVVELASDLGVNERTIRRDIVALSEDIPLETIQGNGGGVKVPEWYRPHKNILSREQTTVLEQLMANADEHQAEVLRQMLFSLGSAALSQKYAKQEEKV